MIFFPNCKINLGLRILRKRGDGYHDLETLFYPLGIKDVLEISPLRASPVPPISPAAEHPDRPSFTAYGAPIPGDTDNNLCVKAYELIKKDFPALPPVHIYLYKHIPIGAGLGGGSSDGAFTLTALNQQFHLQLTTAQLLDYAARLGSDCPFFILNTPHIGLGRGERLAPIDLDLKGYKIILIHPQIHISTARAFSLCKPNPSASSIKDIIRQPITTWRNELVNDFEGPVFQMHPELRAIKEMLYTQGAVYAALTGSGSSLFGIFPQDAAPTLPFHFEKFELSC
ncbi:MAG TPA: 4-(cytidine 5'-diphospho)-2-C-methyl-D-erythritol kinase [Puia sp.]